MKRFIFILLSVLYAPLASADFDSAHWQLADNAKIVEFEGRTALNGSAYLKDVAFLNGTLEVDVWTTGERNFGGFMFRAQSFQEYEWCWLRMHKTNGEVQDGVQYAPVFKGVPCWQLNGGPGGIAPVNLPKNEWVHLKIEISDETAKFYVKDMTLPALVMDHLHLGLKKGSVGLRSESNKGLYYSHFSYRIDESRKKATPEEKTAPANFLTSWKLSPVYQVPDFESISTYPTTILANTEGWISTQADARGLVNITRYHGRSRGSPDCAVLRTTIDAEQDKLVKMHFGYSDATTLFLNQKPIFWGNSAYRSRNMAYGGWTSYNDAVFLDLKKGRNELVVVVAEDFGGWGFQAKIEDIQGIKPQSP